MKIYLNTNTSESHEKLLEGLLKTRLLKRWLNSKDVLSEELKLDYIVDIGNYEEEEFEIKKISHKSFQIYGGSYKALIYGTGKFIRNCQWSSSKFQFSNEVGRSKPDCKIRGMYFATHFYNFYHLAPIEKIREYVEDLALWGINSLQVWFDLHHYKSFDDPAAVNMMKRLKDILEIGQELGMKNSFLFLANEAFKDSPEHLRADPKTHTAHYKKELCPSTEEACQIIENTISAEFIKFKEMGIRIDHLLIWPYDQGGCACEKCYPWGANGLLKISERLSAKLKGIFPLAEITLSTWQFDHIQNRNEWNGIYDQFENKPDWLNNVMIDALEDFPDKPIKEKKGPGGLPVLNFPEISMWGIHPWGGFGANPMPKRFERLWGMAKDIVDGGYPYSEGIHDDYNKFLYASFYWNKEKAVGEISEEYIQSEFGDDMVDEIEVMISSFELNHRFCENKNEVEKTYEIAQQINESHLNGNWRWEILYLRAELDFNRHCNKENNGLPTLESTRSIERLYQLYFCNDKTAGCVKPTLDSKAIHFRRYAIDTGSAI